MLLLLHRRLSIGNWGPLLPVHVLTIGMVLLECEGLYEIHRVAARRRRDADRVTKVVQLGLRRCRASL